ncbi:hypothetical protein GCM10022381_41900 [Leifsonia kafniensis]|uniref:Polysaccharide pyruvyl transferase domain-containing protein n=1 Tax=Leifsonia kafniensis TaxID=475957 RepID=A0ABP7L972_9MICO
MALSTFYWDPDSGLRNPLRRRRFRVGNAGDLFNRDLIEWAYGPVKIRNSESVGGRLLLVGSIAQRAGAGDLLNGVGAKRADLPRDSGQMTVRGVRGPLTAKALADSGQDVSKLEFMGDPGMLIGKIFPHLNVIRPTPGRVLFIPHYRERDQFSSTEDYAICDIDAEPESVGRAICESEVIIASSLHGVIWAHALGRPGIVVTPRTEEPIMKYRDYYESIGATWSPFDDVDDAVRAAAAASAPEVSRVVESITMPHESVLRESGILR